MDEKKTGNNELLQLDVIIEKAIQLPVVRVDRSAFLAEQFSKTDYSIDEIRELGPIGAGISREILAKKANRLIATRTIQSSAASFVAGLPGGLAMAATIPTDIAQFFAIALRLAQELAYLYGAEDLFMNGEADSDRVRGQFLLYVGVMFGASGAVSGVRVLSTQIAKTTAKKLPQKALTKTFWYPILKKLGKAIGVKITKSTVANGVAKAVPVVGGVISGSLNFASMYPMAHRLAAALDDAAFDYTEEEFLSDLETIENAAQGEPGTSTKSNPTGKNTNPLNLIKKGAKSLGEKSLDALKQGAELAKEGVSKIQKKANEAQEKKAKMLSFDEQIVMVRKLKELLDDGIITQEEFEEKKKQLLEL